MDKHILNLKERQALYLSILKDFHAYCEDNNIRYYLACGTLLGAVRHKGFIPWDDDIDVFVPRPDFVRLAHLYSSPQYELHTIYTDKSHQFNFGRLCYNKVYSMLGKRRVFNFGIDVYVINGAPVEEDEKARLFHDVFVHISRKVKYNNFRDGLVRRGLWPFKSLDFSLMNKELFRAEKVFERYDYNTSENIWPYGGGRLILKKELYGTPTKLEFEGGFYYVPEHYHEVLKLGYGDYMKLPPEKDRIPYHGSDFFLTD